MAMNWTMTPESSNIEKFAYDEAAQALYITFKHGATYRYKNVPPATATAFGAAESKGKFFAAGIKKAFDYEKLDAAGT